MRDLVEKLFDVASAEQLYCYSGSGRSRFPPWPSCLSCLPSPAMLLKTRATITWSCIVSFALLSGVGEGFHYLPGCGHPVSAGNTYLWLGALTPGMSLGTGDRTTRVERPIKNRSPVATAECPICQHFSFASSTVTRVVFVAVSALTQALPALDCPQPPPAAARPFQARAPPCV